MINSIIMIRINNTLLQHPGQTSVKKVFTAFLFLFIIFSGCKNAPEKNREKITVATLRGPSAISMIPMIDSLKNIDNYSIDFNIKNEPVQIRPALFREKTTFAVVPTNMASILYNKGVSYKLAAIPVWGTLYLFGQEKIDNWQELKGKKIHLMAKGMTPDIMFKFLLKKHGIDPQKDVDLDYSFPTHIELANAVASGKAKLGVISEPLVSMVMAKNNKVHPLMSLNEEWKKATKKEIPQTALLVQKKMASEKPEVVKAFLSEYEQSVKWVNANPKEAAELIVKHNILNDKKVAIQSIPRCNMHFKNMTEAKKQVNDYLKIFYEMNPKTVGGKLPDEAFYFEQ
jgi:NitT/TauT family transport system substrate-binding protein